MTSDKLDLTSLSFDPREVLMSSEIVLPYPNAKTYSNLAEFEVRVLKGRKPIRQPVISEAPPLIPEEDKSIRRTSDISSDQAPVPTSSKLEKPDVLIRMKTAFNKGPLNLLNKCVQQRIRVKVSIRNYGDIRGTCTGFIVAFDKHWNLAMRDVDETYIKRKTLKTPVLKMLPNECYRTVTVHESSEVIIAQPSFSADSLKEVRLDDSDALNMSSLKIFPTEKIQEIPQESTELSVIETSDLLLESVTRLNLEAECSNKTDEKGTNSRSVLEHGKDTSVAPLTEANEPDTGTQAVLTHYRRKKKQPEVCQRHVNQLFIRGDNVVFIRLLP